jgi:VanZ family protein
MTKFPAMLRAMAFVPWLGAMMYGSHTPTPPGSEELARFANWRPDLWVHFGEYLVLGLLLSAALSLFFRGRWWPVVVGLCAALAAVDEWTQALVPNRVPDAQDGLADLAGAVVAVLIYLWLNRLIKRRRASAPMPGTP